MHEIADVNRDLAEQSKCFTGGTPSDGAKLLPSQIPQPTIKMPIDPRFFGPEQKSFPFSFINRQFGCCYLL